MLSKFISHCVLLLVLFTSINYASAYVKIISCTPEFAAFDHDTSNRTIEIRCTFSEKIHPLDVLWQFSYNNNYRSIVDMDGIVMAPFKHELIEERDHLGQAYSVSILKVPLLNSSYYTLYKCMSVSGSCYKEVKINLRQRAMGYTNSSTKTNSFCLLNLFIILFNVLKMLW